MIDKKLETKHYNNLFVLESLNLLRTMQFHKKILPQKYSRLKKDFLKNNIFEKIFLKKLTFDGMTQILEKIHIETIKIFFLLKPSPSYN